MVRLIVVVAIALAFPAANALAQPLGTFRWQLQPYCNVLTVNVAQQGGIFTLDGTDDLCGAAQPASIVGIAFLNANQTVGFGLTSVLPGGTPVHIEANIALSTVSGTWRDSAGNSGSFVFTPGSGSGGSARPVPSGGIAAGSVTSAQLAAGSVTSAHIADAAVGATELAPSVVAGYNIIDGSVTTVDILDSSLTGNDLAPNSVSGSHVVNGSITTDDLAAPLRAEVVPVPSAGLSVALAAGATLVRAITITAPSAGRVIVGAQGLFDNSPATVDEAACAITTGTTFDANTIEHATFMYEQTSDAMEYVPFALNRGFDVAAGANTFNVVCREYAGNVIVWYTHMTAIFIPQ